MLFHADVNWKEIHKPRGKKNKNEKWSAAPKEKESVKQVLR